MGASERECGGIGQEVVQAAYEGLTGFELVVVAG